MPLDLSLVDVRVPPPMQPTLRPLHHQTRWRGTLAWPTATSVRQRTIRVLVHITVIRDGAEGVRYILPQRVFAAGLRETNI